MSFLVSVRDPHEKVSVGDVVDVEVLNVDIDRGRIGLALLG
ncbi:MAG: S1 RNA-binding domain-containing protein [Anaerolineae bacterium]